jgi:DNA-binding winged helix-turn-helix (wHTH) protein/tetratricopeptide (TPR) repeat protein
MHYYRFRDFRLDPQARELYHHDKLVALPLSSIDCLIYLIQHRERTVGRDELTAAVWDRVDVSEVSLSHAIMRLRRLMGDTGSEQHSIRTIQRLGYRWVLEPTSEETDPIATVAPDVSQAAPMHVAAPAITVAQTGHVSPEDAQRNMKSRRFGLILLLLSLFSVSLFALLPAWRTHAPANTSANTKRLPAMVLPAEVKAPENWAWLRFGFMDLVANHLRRGELATTPSETVVSLVNAGNLDTSAGLKGAPVGTDASTLLIHPQVALVNGLWNVRLEARWDKRDLIAEAQAVDVLAAGRTAADDLLLKLGHTPPTTGDATEPTQVVEELMQRVNAAVLAGQLQVARSLISSADPAAQASPEIALSTAAIEFFSGEYEASREHAEALLDHLPKDRNPRLRARVLNRLGATYFRQGRLDDADAVFVEAISLLQLQNDADTLATAYTGRGAVAGRTLRLDAAVAFFGQARTLHEMSNDAFGVARVDLNLGSIAMDRGQPAAAIPIFENAANRFQVLATPEALNSALSSLADAQSMLLEHDQALATTERFWPVETHSRNAREAWWLTLSRAIALTGKGRLRDADDLLKRVLESSDPVEDAVARIEAQSLAANLALLRGDNVSAASLAASALTPALENSNWQDYASTWFIRVRALQRGGKIAAAGEELKRLRTWAELVPSDRRLLYVELAEADQALVEGNSALALQRYAQTMTRAERLGVPDDIVVVGEPYVEALIATGEIDQASAISGRLAPWADKDMRAAFAQAQIYRALRKADAARAALDKARLLAGERLLLGDSMPSGQ